MSGSPWSRRRPSRPVRYGRWIGLALALAFAGLLAFDSYGGSGFDDLEYALPATLVLFPAGAGLAAAVDGSVAAGLRAALWAGILSGLAFAIIVPLSTVGIVRAGTDPTYLAEFARAKAADLTAYQTYTVSEALGAGVIMLILLPAWALLLGLVGVAAGDVATRSRDHEVSVSQPRRS